jgi:hypothetical protein
LNFSTHSKIQALIQSALSASTSAMDTGFIYDCYADVDSASTDVSSSPTPFGLKTVKGFPLSYNSLKSPALVVSFFMYSVD